MFPNIKKIFTKDEPESCCSPQEEEQKGQKENQKEEKTMPITQETTLEEVLKHKGAEEILSHYNLPCLHCPMSAMEMGVLKIGEVCKTYGIDSDKVLAELQKLPSAQE